MKDNTKKRAARNNTRYKTIPESSEPPGIVRSHWALGGIRKPHNSWFWVIFPFECLPAAVAIIHILPFNTGMASRANWVSVSARQYKRFCYAFRETVWNCFVCINRCLFFNSHLFSPRSFDIIQRYQNNANTNHWTWGKPLCVTKSKYILLKSVIIPLKKSQHITHTCRNMAHTSW